MPRDNKRRHHLRATTSGPDGGPYRTHKNPAQFPVNPLGVNLYGYKARDFSGKRASPEKFARAMKVLGKLIYSRGSQAVLRERRTGLLP